MDARIFKPNNHFKAMNNKRVYRWLDVEKNFSFNTQQLPTMSKYSTYKGPIVS